MWGTVGSVLTPGSHQDRKNPDFRIPDLENPEKLYMTYQIKALGKLVNELASKIWISRFLIPKIGEKIM